MNDYPNHDTRLERELLGRIAAAAIRRYGDPVPANVAGRIDTETKHICEHGGAPAFAAAARIADISREHGYHVGFRGLAGNLVVSHLLGIAAMDPMTLGLRWEGCLGWSGNKTPEITLNVAPELLEDLNAYLAGFLPGHESAVRLCPHELMGLAGKAVPLSGVPFRQENDFSGALIARAYRDDVSGIPVLDGLDGFRDFARALEPKTFHELVKIMGLCLAPDIQYQVDRFAGSADPFSDLISTREDVYDLLVRHGIGERDAFAVMQQVGRNGSGRQAAEYRDMLAGRGLPDAFLETAAHATYLYPRGQCANYLYWVLALLKYRG